MKLLLTSSGFSSKMLVNACSDMVGKTTDAINFAVINEAYSVEEGDKRWMINELNAIVDNFGGELDIVNLLALKKEEVSKRLKKSDVIYCVGGNTDYLMHVFINTGFDELLRSAIEENKVYVGSSAGSMVLGKRISTDIYQSIYGEVKTFGTEDYMEVIDFSVKPHLNLKLFPNNSTQKLSETLRDTTETVYAIPDAEAVGVINDRIELYGDGVMKFN